VARFDFVGVKVATSSESNQSKIKIVEYFSVSVLLLLLLRTCIEKPTCRYRSTHLARSRKIFRYPILAALSL